MTKALTKTTQFILKRDTEILCLIGIAIGSFMTIDSLTLIIK